MNLRGLVSRRPFSKKEAGSRIVCALRRAYAERERLHWLTCAEYQEEFSVLSCRRELDQTGRRLGLIRLVQWRKLWKLGWKGLERLWFCLKKTREKRVCSFLLD